MIKNCFFFKKDDNTKMKKNASFFSVFLGKERGRIAPGYPGIGVTYLIGIIVSKDWMWLFAQTLRIKSKLSWCYKWWIQVNPP